MLNLDYTLTPTDVPLRRRVGITPAPLKEVQTICRQYHYSHKAWGMAQLPYWVTLDGEAVGVLLMGSPRLGRNFRMHPPMSLLRVCRFWVHSPADRATYTGSDGRVHTLWVRACALAQAVRRCRQDWARRFPVFQPIECVVAWADDEHDEVELYRALNFTEIPVEDRDMNWHMPNRPRPPHAFWYEFDVPLSELQLYRIRQEGLRELYNTRYGDSHSVDQARAAKIADSLSAYSRYFV